MERHCCDRMKQEVEYVCEQHPNRFECPDCLLHFSPKHRQYGLIVHDGGKSSIGIRFCPWCGAALPAALALSERDSQQVMELLENPPPANARLLKAARDLLDRS